MTWKKGKIFTKNGKRVRWIYPNGKKKGKKLVPVKGGRSTKRGRTFRRRKRYY